MALILAEPCVEPGTTLTAGEFVPVGWSDTISGTNSPSIISATDRYGVANHAWSARSGFGSNVSIEVIKNYTADADSTVIIGFAFIPSFSITQTIARVYSSSGALRGTLSFAAIGAGIPGKLTYTPNGAGVLADSVVAVVDSAAWYYIELKVVCHASTGTATIKVNERVVAIGTGNTTGGQAGTDIGQASILMLTNGSGSNQCSFDDIYICSGAGATNNDFLGDVRVSRLRPNAAGDSTGFTAGGGGSAANHWDNVDNLMGVSGSATPYNAGATAGLDESYNLTDLPAALSGQAIFGVIQHSFMYCNILNVGMSHFVKDSGAESESTTVATTTSAPINGANAASPAIATQSRYSRVLETKPSGGAWSYSEVNGMRAGARIKTIT